MKKEEIAELKPGDIIINPGFVVDKPAMSAMSIVEYLKKIGPKDYIVMIKEIIMYGMGNVIERDYGKVKRAFSTEFFHKLDLKNEKQRRFLLAASKDILIHIFKYM